MNKPITINDPSVRLNLLFIDKVLNYLTGLLKIPSGYNKINYLDCFYSIDLITLLFVINSIKNNDEDKLEFIDSEFIRELKITYSFLKKLIVINFFVE